jgi:Raf kinase inhibitor-like YbhB/YbcL family protein
MPFLSFIGKMLRPVRPGPTKIVSARPEFRDLLDVIVVESPAFTTGTRMAQRFTSLGDEISPPLKWRTTPPLTKDLLLIVEDADPPMPQPIVHAIAYNIPSDSHEIQEGAMPAHHKRKQTPDGKDALQPEGFVMGVNTMGARTWLGPAPIPGHGVHHYYFQLFALDIKLEFEKPPTKKDVLKAIRGHVLAMGSCMGTYQQE